MTAATITRAAPEIVIEALQFHMMLATLPPAEMAQILPLFEVREFKTGAVIGRQGAVADGLYLVHEGRIRLKRHEDGKVASVGLVVVREAVGEMALLGETAWPADLIAAEPVTCLVLPAEPVRLLASGRPALASHLTSHVGFVEVGNQLRRLLDDRPCSPAELMPILRQCGLREWRKGATVFDQGDEDPRLYLIEVGAVELVRTPLAGESLWLDRAGGGDLIGVTGALSGLEGGEGRHGHTAVAAEDTTAIVIRSEAVEALCHINPGLLERMRERSRELARFEQEEAAVRRRSEGIDQRIRLAQGVTEDEFLALKDRREIVNFPVVRQNKPAQAAAACLSMICRHYGKDLTLGQIREVTNLDSESITPDHIIRGAEQLGFRAKAYALTYEELKTVRLPGIVSWEGYHYIVAFDVAANRVQLADPAQGLRALDRKTFDESWTSARVAGVGEIAHGRGVFIALEPTQAFEREIEPGRPYRYFINFLLPNKAYFAEAMLAALVINLLGLASPLFVQTIVDTVVVHHDAGLLNMMLAGMVLVAIASTAMTTVQAMLLAHTTARIDMSMMSEFYRHVLSLPMTFFLSRNKGDILTRFGENQKIRAIITGSSITVLLNTLMITVYFLMMFAYSVPLTFLVMFFIPFFIGIVVYFTPRIKKLAQEIFLTNSQSQSYLIESLNGIESLKATANEYFARARWEDAFAENVNRAFQQQRLSLTSQALFRLATTAMTILVLWIGATEVIAGTMTIGELMGFNMLMNLVTQPVLQMVNLWNDFQEIRIAVDRVGDILTVQPEQPPASRRMPATVTQLEGRIEFRKVNFGYTTSDKTKLIMQEFDLTIEPGQRVAFVGPSGCGKSTIAKMVLGFNVPMQGELLIDGKNITQLDLYSVRRNIGMVLQDSFVFGGTVAENIALGDPEPDLAVVKEAARMAGADEFIVNYPQGYQTRIGEKGIGISGGQRQRICIARALYNKPRILVFDEATSALDNESEERITQALKSIMRNRTSITIAHRLSTIVDSDVICFIKDGKVQEKGAHKQLIDAEYLKMMNYTGMYHQLARGQFDLPPLEMG